MDLLLAAIGWLGAGLLLLAYWLVSAGRIPTESALFQVLNLLGAGALVANSGYHQAWPSAVLNIAWIGIGLGALSRARGRESPRSGRRAAQVR